MRLDTNKIKFIILFLFLFFPYVSLANIPQDHTICFDKIVLHITVGPGGPEACDLSMTLDKVIQMYPDGPPPHFSPDATNCNAGRFVDAGNCTTIIQYCCNTSIRSYNDFVRQIVVITGVEFGKDYDAASLALSRFVSETAAKQCAPGFQRVGFSAGVVYDFEQVGANTVDVFASLYNRILCSRAGDGEMLPLQNLANLDDFRNPYQSFRDAIRDSGIVESISNVESLLRPDSGGALDATNVLLTEIRDKPVSVVGGGGLSLSDTELAVSRGVRSALEGVGGSVVVTPSSPAVQQAYTSLRLPLSDTINFQNRFTEFFNDMRQTPLFFNFGLDPLGQVSSGSSIFSFSAGQFGDVVIDMSDYSFVFPIVKGFFLLLGSYLAVRIVILKR